MTQTQFVIMEGIISFFLICGIIALIRTTRRIPGAKKCDEFLNAFTYLQNPTIRNSPKKPYV
jgi:hypothetical protein